MKLPRNAIIIHGAAQGADHIAGKAASALGFDVIAVPAKWHIYGRSAGPRRNKEMLDMNPNLVIAFHADITKSKGTKNMLSIARRAKIDTELITE